MAYLSISLAREMKACCVEKVEQGAAKDRKAVAIDKTPMVTISIEIGGKYPNETDVTNSEYWYR